MVDGPYDALLVVSFGGPEGPDEVMPFLENVVRGRSVPRERLLAVAEHYHVFGGVSPIAAQTRALVDAVRAALRARGPNLPVYLGNRNWRPLLADTLRKMAADGVRRALAFVTSAFGSYSGCRQYLEDIARARAEVGPGAPEVHKLRAFFNHPGFVLPMGQSVLDALGALPPDRRDRNRVVFTAHSIPVAMAHASPYVEQVREASRLVADQAAVEAWDLVWQSRSGPPSVPWLEPDVLEHLAALGSADHRDAVLVPIGFTSDHMEVVYDLDVEARARADSHGLGFVRAATVGTHPDFIEMVRELILERVGQGQERRSLGSMGPAPDRCAPECCPPPQRPAGRPASS